MKLLISPAKKMREDGDFLAPRQAPALLERAAVLAEWLRCNRARCRSSPGKRARGLP